MLEAGCLFQDSHCQLGLESIKNISLERFLMKKCPEANSLVVIDAGMWDLIALGSTIAKASTWGSLSGLK